MSKVKSLWKGPEKDGVTQSMLNDFILCRERFRVKYIEGWREEDQFFHRMEYGNMFHLCEEVYRRGDDWNKALHAHTKVLCQKYKGAQEQIIKWYNVCKAQFPIYVSYWKRHEKGKKQKSLFSEKVFAVPYELPSGRVVLLKGKWDGCHKREVKAVWLDEHKTKADIKEGQLQRQLLFDLQTMTYCVAFNEYLKTGELGKGLELGGFNYNVVRRPLGGGKYSISPYKPSKTNPTGETDEQFYNRLANLIREDQEWFFMRWEVTVLPSDLQKFQSLCLNPLLEQLFDWWEYTTGVIDKPHYLHFRTPYGIYNPLAEGGSTPLDDYIDTGSTLGLQRSEKLFRELGE